VLLEIRELRHDLQLAAIAARKAQIAIYRLPEQELAVEGATQQLERAKGILEQMRNQQGVGKGSREWPPPWNKNGNREGD
jgi:hypothetical protein